MPRAPWKTPVEIKYLLEEMLGVQVRTDNDCVMLALAENGKTQRLTVIFA